MPWDFSHLNLQGRSFKGQDLTDANFSHSDIRGANFTNTILRNAKFINAKAGLQLYWEVALVVGSILLAIVSGLASAVIGGFAGLRLTIGSQPYGILISAILLITLAAFCVFTIRQGIVAALETMFWTMALIVTVYAAAALVVAIAMVMTATGPSAVAIAWTRVGTVGGTVITAGVMALQLAIILILLTAGPLAVALAWTVAGAVAGAVVAVGALVGAVFGVLYSLALAAFSSNILPAVWAMVGIVPVAGRSVYVSWRFLAGDKKHGFVWKVAIALAAIGGTKFRGADLTDADFTGATLENTDFRRATLTGICWFQSKRLFSTRF
ncbi:MAG TPA: pentapeptide repeat-containing protein [Waterburya sp.]|jgi:hypothetical protein